jgi:hypothetical protein
MGQHGCVYFGCFFFINFVLLIFIIDIKVHSFNFTVIKCYLTSVCSSLLIINEKYFSYNKNNPCPQFCNASGSDRFIAIALKPAIFVETEETLFKEKLNKRFSFRKTV